MYNYILLCTVPVVCGSIYQQLDKCRHTGGNRRLQVILFSHCKNEKIAVTFGNGFHIILQQQRISDYQNKFHFPFDLVVIVKIPISVNGCFHMFQIQPDSSHIFCELLDSNYYS